MCGVGSGRMKEMLRERKSNRREKKNGKENKERNGCYDPLKVLVLLYDGAATAD